MITKYDVVAGVFDDARRAEQAIADLYRAGFPIDRIDMVTRSQGETQGTPDFALQKNAADGTAAGAVTGAGLGAIAGALAATVALPGIGAVLSAGLIAAVIGGSALLGAAGGSLVGTFVALEMSEEDARYYARAVQQEGRTVVLVQTAERQDEAWAILKRHGARQRQTTGAVV